MNAIFTRQKRKRSTPPIRYEGREDRDGYVMIATNVPLFKDINKLLILHDPRRLDEGNGIIEETLRKKQSKISPNLQTRV